MIAAQARRRSRAAIALAMICLLVAGGVLGRLHEAEVAHVTDAQTGVTSHALDTDCHDGAPASHMHGVPADEHADVCSLTAALHQPTRIATSSSIAIVVIENARATAPPVVAHVQTPILIAAPKTSPPAVRA